MHKISIEMKSVFKSFGEKKSFLFEREKSLNVINNVSLKVKAGEIFGLVGESGCGKSTLAKMLVGLLQPDSGDITIEGKPINKFQRKDLSKKIQYVFQNPVASLNPKLSIHNILSTPLKTVGGLTEGSSHKKLLEILDAVNMPRSSLEKFPHEFSGGQAQRLCLARALLAQPDILVLDEPVSALDVSIQAQILELLIELKKEFNLTFIFISHDLSIVEAFCNSVSVLYYGEVVEQSSAKKIFRYPRHPYTELLVKSVPTLLSDIQITDNGKTPNLFEEQKGCLFSPRCNYSRSTCFKKDIKLESLGESYVRCNFPIKKNSKQKKKRIKSTNGGGRVY